MEDLEDQLAQTKPFKLEGDPKTGRRLEQTKPFKQQISQLVAAHSKWLLRAKYLNFAAGIAKRCLGYRQAQLK
jgi:hypothetical protein